MKPKVRATRALAAYTTARSLRLVSLIALGGFSVVIALIGFLALEVSAAWWMLLPFVMIVAGVFLLLRYVIKRIIRSIYPDPLSQAQRQVLHGLTGKVVHLAEARSTPLSLLALITLKDIVIRRDITTIRSLFSDSKNLASDLSELEKQFKDR